MGRIAILNCTYMNSPVLSSSTGTGDLCEEMLEVKKDIIACPYCPKVFSGSLAKGGLRSNYNRHLLTHSKERPYQCEDCEKGFATSTNLKRHVKRRHPESFLSLVERFSGRDRSRPQTPIAPGACGEKVFPSSAVISDQSNSIVNSIDHSSSVLEFPLSSFFRENLPPVIPQAKLYQCQSCERQFVWRTSLMQHINMYHREILEQYICFWCQAPMSSRTKLRRHQRYHCPFRDDDHDFGDEKECDRDSANDGINPMSPKLTSPVSYTIRRFPNVAENMQQRLSQGSSASGNEYSSVSEVEPPLSNSETGKSSLIGDKRRRRHVTARRRSCKSNGVLVHGECNGTYIFPPIPTSSYMCPFDVCKKVFAKQKYLKSHLKRVHKIGSDAMSINDSATATQKCEN